MNVIVFAVSHEIPGILRRGPSDPLFGAFLDAGSYGSVRDVAPGSRAFDDLFGREFETAARSAGVAFVRGPDAPADHASGTVLVVARMPLEIDQTSMGDRAWHEVVKMGDALVLVVVDALDTNCPLWILVGNELPVMGPTEPCTRADLWNTLFALAGRASGSGRFLLTEHEASPDPFVEERLSGRLRELYGE